MAESMQTIIRVRSVDVVFSVETFSGFVCAPNRALFDTCVHISPQENCNPTL